jgi:hypothetical protein
MIVDVDVDVDWIGSCLEEWDVFVFLIEINSARPWHIYILVSV